MKIGHRTNNGQKIEFEMIICPVCRLESSDLAWKHNNWECPTSQCGYTMFSELERSLMTLQLTPPLTAMIQ